MSVRPKAERSELWQALSASRDAFVMTGFFSLFINLLLLTAPLYMLQIYDRVLASRSVGTLVAMSVLAAAMLLTFGALDVIRSRILDRIAGQFDSRLSKRVFDAMFVQRLKTAQAQPYEPLRDLGTMRQFLAGPGPATLFDVPWVPVFLAIVFLIHPLLGAITLVGAIVLLGLTLLIEAITRKRLLDASREIAMATSFASTSLRNAEVVAAMGMLGSLRTKWLAQYERGLAMHGVAGDRSSTLKSCSKVVRMLLQIALLGAGAALAIEKGISPGSIVATSIIAARALAPVEQAIGQWQMLIAARAAYGRLVQLLQLAPVEVDRMPLPAPSGNLSVENVVALPPDKKSPILKGVSFKLAAGEVLGVIGPSASGKSTLARLLIGVWLPGTGSIRLDGCEIHHVPQNELGKWIGYLPQDVELFDGTIADNIARFAAKPDPDQIVLAAKRAGVHELILRLPDGYETRIGENGSFLSAGQRQRIALARTIYGDPALIVLDEPNSNLDAEGDQALTQTIVNLKRSGRTVVVMAHRPSAIAAVDKLLVLRDGKIHAFGPKEEILAAMTAAAAATSQGNSGKIARIPGQA